MKIYLDACCLNRPYDDQSNYKIHLESEAVLTILSFCEEGKYTLINSEVIEFEIGETPDIVLRDQLYSIIRIAKTKILLSDNIVSRAKYFESMRINAFDALHLACAEDNADILFTVDNNFLKKANEIIGLRVTISNPLNWIIEVANVESK